MQRLWLIAGLVTALGGFWIWWQCYPSWSVRVPADVAFALTPLVGLANVAGALARWRSPSFLLIANVLAGLVIGGFAAFQLESFAAWVGGTVVATAPSVAALVAHWRTK